jgi:hypothetical protein
VMMGYTPRGGEIGIEVGKVYFELHSYIELG